jgi:hypothetical protein
MQGRIRRHADVLFGTDSAFMLGWATAPNQGRGLTLVVENVQLGGALLRRLDSAFSKNPDCPKKSGLPRRHVAKQQPTKQQKFSPNKPGGRANVFSFYVIITLTLRFRLRYVTVAGATFSFTLRRLRYRSGREAHRGSR